MNKWDDLGGKTVPLFLVQHPDWWLSRTDLLGLMPSSGGFLGWLELGYARRCIPCNLASAKKKRILVCWTFACVLRNLPCWRHRKYNRKLPLHSGSWDDRCNFGLASYFFEVLQNTDSVKPGLSPRPSWDGTSEARVNYARRASMQSTVSLPQTWWKSVIPTQFLWLPWPRIIMDVYRYIYIYIWRHDMAKHHKLPNSANMVLYVTITISRS